MDSVISLDFGSAYTKVAIRRGLDQASELMEEPSLNLDEQRICIPTVVAKDQRGSMPRWAFGIEAATLKEGQGIRVHRNWKPLLFAATEPRLEPEETPRQPDPTGRPNDVAGFLNALKEAKEGRQALYLQIAQLVGVMVEEVASIAERWPLDLKSLRLAIMELQAQQGGPKPTTEARRAVDDGEVHDVALNFFRWLRGFAMEAFRVRGITGVEKMPLRICVPTFAPQGPAEGLSSSEELLLNILAKAGWTLDAERGKIDEPFANAIGTLTGGVNLTWIPNQREGKRFPNLGQMFAESGLLKALRGERAEHVLLVIDVGAYTSDFAVMTFDLSDAEVRPSIRTHSVPLGVDRLDREVQSLMPPAKAELVAAMDFGRREALKGHIYVETSPYRTEAGPIGGGDEGERIGLCIDGFGARIADQADRSVRDAGVERVDELILTGGGNNIPRLRSTLRDRLQHRDVLKTHLPLRKGEPDAPRVHRLDQKLVRGASALGAVSVYFDRL